MFTHAVELNTMVTAIGITGRLLLHCNLKCEQFLELGLEYISPTLTLFRKRVFPKRITKPSLELNHVNLIFYLLAYLYPVCVVCCIFSQVLTYSFALNRFNKGYPSDLVVRLQRTENTEKRS